MRINKIAKFKTMILASVFVTLSVLFATTALTSSAPSNTIPEFNKLTDVVGGVGTESDFVRVRKSGTQDPFNNLVNDACTNGQEISIQVYIHNSSNNNVNGENLDGPVVAKGTKLSLTDGGKTVDGAISASNAASVFDNATITCNGKEVDYDFVAGSAVIKTAVQDYVKLSDNVFTAGGTPIGYAGQDGIFPACYEYRAWVYAKVVVKVVEAPVVSKECVIADVKKLTRTRFQITANAAVKNANVTSYVFTTKNASGTVVDTKTFNTSALSQAYEVEQANAGTYTVKAVINTNKGVAGGDCETKFTVDEKTKEPSYSCDMFNFTFKDRKGTVSFVANGSNGAVFKDATIVYYADGSVKNTDTTNKVTDGKVVSTYTFDAKAKNVQAKASVRFNVTEKGQTVVKVATCEGNAVLGTTTTPPVTPPTTTLPDTGAGSFAGIFAAVTVAGALAHRKFTLRRG